MSLGYTEAVQRILVVSGDLEYLFNVAYFSGNHKQQITVHHGVYINQEGDMEWTELIYDTDYTIEETPNIVSDTLISIKNDDVNSLDAYRPSEGIQLGGKIKLINAFYEGEIYVMRKTSITQDVDMAGKTFPADIVEGSFDKVYFIIQEIIASFYSEGVVPSIKNMRLTDLVDVRATDPEDKNVIHYDSVTGYWVTADKGEGFEYSRYDDLLDVNAHGKEDDYVFRWSELRQKYVPKPPFILGEIRAMMLTETQLRNQEKNWLPCTGVVCGDTEYGALTGNMYTPNIMGKVLRGLDPSGLLDPDGPNRTLGDVQMDSTRLPNTQFTGVTSHIGDHTHEQYSTDHHSAGDYWDDQFDAAEADQYGPTGPAGAHEHTTTVTGGGDVETRMKNLAVNYYIYVGKSL